MCLLKNSDVLVKYLPAPRGQRPLSRNEIVIHFSRLSSHFLLSGLQGPPRLECGVGKRKGDQKFLLDWYCEKSCFLGLHVFWS